jgi:uncharacterized damage-inducible protein DinB
MKILDKWFENLREIREELMDTVKNITEEEFTWVPKPGMKSAKALLIEIAAGELWLDHFLTNPEPISWKSAFELVKGNTLESLSLELESIRKKTIQLFSQYTEAELFEEKAWPNDPDKTMSPEETMRYLIQHEYYHLGQLIYNRWMLGYNPFQSEVGTSG